MLPYDSWRYYFWVLSENSKTLLRASANNAIIRAILTSGMPYPEDFVNDGLEDVFKNGERAHMKLYYRYYEEEDDNSVEDKLQMLLNESAGARGE